MIDHAGVAEVLRRFAGTLVGEYELDDVLSGLGKDVASTLGCAGAGAMLADADEQLRFVATSDEVLGELERLQIELDEGPCLLAYRSCQPVVSADLASDERFPRFGPRAIAAGMRAVYSFPMHLQETAIGALNLYAPEAGDLSHEALEIGRTYADVATIYVVHARDLADHEELTTGLQKALDTRIVIEQAKGYLAARADIDTKAAFELLRSYARPRGTRVRVVAQRLLAGDLDVAELQARP